MTLVIERPVNATTPMQPRAAAPPPLELLSNVVKRDLQRKPAEAIDAKLKAKGRSVEQRARGLLGIDDDDR